MSQNVHGAQDILSGLLPFLQPLIADRQNKLFNPGEFAQAVTQTYGWPVSTDVIEELIPRLEAHGWLQLASSEGGKAAYICRADPAFDGPSDQIAASILNRIQESLFEFVKHFSSLLTFSYGPDELLDVFLNWLVSVEGFDRISLLSTAKALASKSFKLTLEPSKSIFADVSVVDSDSAYLSARYIQHLVKNDPELLQHIIEISSLALLTEVILDFRTPPNAARQEPGLLVLLDGPFVMDALALCGADRERNAREIIDCLKRMGCQIKVFSHSSDEIRDNLQGVLRRSPGQRFGPTAEAMRRSELDADYARAVCANPDHFIHEELGIEILNWNLNLFPSEHQFFSDHAYEELMGVLHFHTNISARERDAKSIAMIMRRRAGKQSRDVFRTRYFLITRNHLLASCSREFCVQRELLRRGDEGPVITQRRVAALLWLTLGAHDRQELSRRQLMVACERVSQIRPELIDGAMRKLRKVKADDLPKLEALLTQPRSTQLLIDLTLNKQEVVTEDNVEEILDMMRKAASGELEHEKKREVRAIRKEAREEVGRYKQVHQMTEKSLASREEELQRAHGRLEDNSRKDAEMLQRWADDSGRFVGSAIRVEKALLWALAAALAIGGWLLDTDSMPRYAWLIAWGLAALTFFFAVLSISSKGPNVLRPWITRTRDRRFAKKVEEAGRADLLECYEIDWESTKVKSRDSAHGA